jgi:hypothetical protein
MTFFNRNLVGPILQYAVHEDVLSFPGNHVLGVRQFFEVEDVHESPPIWENEPIGFLLLRVEDVVHNQDMFHGGGAN